VPRPSAGPFAEVIGGLMVKDTTARMPLPEVRRRISGLLPDAGRSVFTPEAVGQAEARAAEQPTRMTSSAPPRPSVAPSLASDPGPLPFAPKPPPSSRRTPRALVLVLAVLLFLATAAGGFALTRYIGGRPLTPARATGNTEQPVPPVEVPVGQLTERTGNAAGLRGVQGGEFRILVPQGWLVFMEDRTSKLLPQSTRVHYVSPDGRYQLTVERFPNFFRQHTIAKYRQALAASWPKDNFKLDPAVEIPGGNGAEPAYQLRYRTVDTSDRARHTPDLLRTTFANLLPQGNDLWTVSLTVPNTEEDSARRDLFDKIAPSFIR
jgi:eukaryotic-like serine/threonine-protein kinase